MKKKERPAHAETCPSCGGSGVMDEENFNLMRCNECFGDGWIIPFNIDNEEIDDEDELLSIIHGEDDE